MSNQNVSTGELKPVSFVGMFNEDFQIRPGTTVRIAKVVIPRIQRDYAQGRTTKKVTRVRERFLQAIYEKLEKGESLRLDFVYGDVDSTGNFTPFDGQQRLTTLFLLHWYGWQLSQDQSVSATNLLTRFSYETRPSSRLFCKKLAEGEFSFTKNASDSVSDQIRNSSKFVMSWENDPTIAGMLCMLDAIDEKFSRMSDLWERLVERELVQFYVLPLSGMGLDDKLYIKMNARGKPLTDFEHFKAEFEKESEKCSESLRREIALKFDTKWTRVLFPYRDRRDDTVDGALLNYFKFVSRLICWREGLEYDCDEFRLVELYAGQKERIEYFRDMMDCWAGHEPLSVQSEYFSANKHEDGKVTLFRSDVDLLRSVLVGEGGTNADHLLLYATCLKLQLKDKITEDEFRCRVRSLRNLLYNSSDQMRPDNMQEIFSETEALILHGVLPDGKRGFSTSQKEDEQRKAAYLKSHLEIRLSIERIEDLAQFKGGLSAVSETNYSKDNEFASLFSFAEQDRCWGIVQQALLTFGDYSRYFRRNHCFGADPADSVYVRELFQPSAQRQNFEGAVAALNSLIGKLDFRDVRGSISKMIAEYLTETKQYDWRYYFVKYSGEARGCYGKYLWWHYRREYSFLASNFVESPYEITLLSKEQLNGMNWNWFLYVLSKHSLLSSFKMELGAASYHHDLLEIGNERKISVDCLNDHYEVGLPDGTVRAIKIPQANGIDTVDRVDFGALEIRKILDDMCV